MKKSQNIPFMDEIEIREAYESFLQEVATDEMVNAMSPAYCVIDYETFKESHYDDLENKTLKIIDKLK